MNNNYLLALCLATGLIGGCSSLESFMDSSHGPQGTSNTINTQTAGRNTPAPVVNATTVNSHAQSTVSSTSQVQQVSTTPQAGVIKPYAAYEQEAQSVENQLLSTRAGTEPVVSPVPESSTTNATVQNAASLVEDKSGPKIIDITQKSDNSAVHALTSEVSMSGHCTGDLNSKVQNYAQDLAIALAGKLQVDSGEIFVAPTVIPDEYQDCVSDAQQSIKNAFSQTNNFKPSSISEAAIYQNAGSSTVIPRLVRACRSKSIPYLCYTTLGKRGNKLRITMRIIRISDGITLTQDYKNLE